MPENHAAVTVFNHVTAGQWNTAGFGERTGILDASLEVLMKRLKIHPDDRLEVSEAVHNIANIYLQTIRNNPDNKEKQKKKSRK